MDKQLEEHIYALLKKKKRLDFNVKLNIQGGPLVEVFLSNKKLGIYYQFDPNTNQHKQIQDGSEIELQLESNLQDWIKAPLFTFMINNDYLDKDVFKGNFLLIEDQVYLKLYSGSFSMAEIGDGEKEDEN
uniref:hypothetical protein n=1 Tax=Algoriphagus sp. TaxID=1872435 RepID=UPI0040473297